MSTAPALELLRAARIPESAAEAYARALAGMGFDTAEALAYLEEDDLQAAGLLLGHLRVLRAFLRDGGGRAAAATAARAWWHTRRVCRQPRRAVAVRDLQDARQGPRDRTLPTAGIMRPGPR